MEKDKEKDEYLTSLIGSVKKDDTVLILENKTATDAKNSQAKIVRGTKKMRVDSTDSNQITDKKGNILSGNFNFKKFLVKIFRNFLCKTQF